MQDSKLVSTCNLKMGGGIGGEAVNGGTVLGGGGG